MVADYQAYHKMRNPLEFSPLVSGRLDEVTYEAIGKEMTSSQIYAMSIHDINVKKLLYGVAMECLDICDSWAPVDPVIAKDKFIGWGYSRPPTSPGMQPTPIKENCFDYCVEQLKVVGRRMMTPGWGTSKEMYPGIYQLYLTEDVAGMKKGHQVRGFVYGVLYLKAALEGGIPVVVGVEDRVGSTNTDKVTDHFVTIVGMGGEIFRGNYFLFYDNATSETKLGTSSENRLYCDCDKFEIKGTGPNGYAQHFGSYIVTQIRQTLD
jgi:hypothetical protein